MSITAVIDYGVGNLFSLCSSLRAVSADIGAEVTVTADPTEIRRADRIILPGVGAFADAIAKLREAGLDQVLCEEAAQGKPIMGICLGMQLLFEESHEYGVHRGLGTSTPPHRVRPTPFFAMCEKETACISSTPTSPPTVTCPRAAQPSLPRRSTVGT